MMTQSLGVPLTSINLRATRWHWPLVVLFNLSVAACSDPASDDDGPDEPPPGFDGTAATSASDESSASTSISDEGQESDSRGDSEATGALDGTTISSGSESSGAPPPDEPLAAGIAVMNVEVNQGVGVAVAADGSVVEPNDYIAPIIAGRGALFRASYELAPNFESRTIVGRLWLRHGTDEPTEFLDSRVIDGPSRWDELSGTFAWEIPPDQIQGDTEFRIELLESSPTTDEPEPSPDAELPAGGEFTELGAWDDRMEIDIMLVPFTCPGEAMIDLNERDLTEFETYLYNTFPAQKINIEVHDFIHSDSCDHVDAAEYVLPDLRDAEGADPWVYYGGLMPGGGGGYSVNIDDSDQMDFRRTFANHTWRHYGLTFDLFAHELGHSHGVHHTFEDPDYPGNNDDNCGSRSSYGWGIRSGLMPNTGYSNDIEIGMPWVNPHEQLVLPTDRICDGLPNANQGSFSDMMSYAYPYWISAYNYSAFADRVRLISTWPNARRAPQSPIRSSRLLFGPEGEIRRFQGPAISATGRTDAWATCTVDGKKIRRPVQRTYSVEEVPHADGGGYDAYDHVSYELLELDGIDPQKCVLDVPGRNVRFR